METTSGTLNSFNTNVILYAKGHYIWSHRVMSDLQIIAQRTGNPTDPKQILLNMALLTSDTIFQLGNEYTLRSDGVRSLASQDSSPQEELAKLFIFTYDNREEIIKKYAPNILDDDSDFTRKHMEMLQEQLLYAMLVTIAKGRFEDLPEPLGIILPLTNPKERRMYDKFK